MRTTREKPMVALKWRAVVFASVTTSVLTYWYIWDTSMFDPRRWPMPNLPGSTWYGPFLVLLIPVSLGWLAFAAKRRYARVLGLLCTSLVLIISLYLIYYGKSEVSTLPSWLPPIGGWVR